MQFTMISDGWFVRCKTVQIAFWVS